MPAAGGELGDGLAPPCAIVSLAGHANFLCAVSGAALESFADGVGCGGRRKSSGGYCASNRDCARSQAASHSAYEAPPAQERT